MDMRVGPILYLHDMSEDKAPDVVKKSLTLFRKICGEDAMVQVAIVTTRWDRLGDVKKGTARVEELATDFWPEMLVQGARTFHVQPSDKDIRFSKPHMEPWDIIHQIVSTAVGRNDDRRPIRIQDEIVNLGKVLADTDVGGELRLQRADGDFWRMIDKMMKDIRLRFVRRAKESVEAGRKSDQQAKNTEEGRSTLHSRLVMVPQVDDHVLEDGFESDIVIP